MKQFVICGLARSGTTILARFAESLEGVIVFHEPFQCAIRNIHNEEYWVSLFPCFTSSTRAMVIKEPFYIVKRHCQMLNANILQAFDKREWGFIFITRNLLDVYVSQKKWGVTIDEFVETYKEFTKFVCGRNAIRYEEFCKDPVGEWNRVVPELEVTNPVSLRPIRSSMFLGCPRAKESKEICINVKPIHGLTEEEIKTLTAISAS